MNKNNNRDKLPLICKLIVPENTKNRGDMFGRFSSLTFQRRFFARYSVSSFLVFLILRHYFL